MYSVPLLLATKSKYYKGYILFSNILPFKPDIYFFFLKKLIRCRAECVAMSLSVHEEILKVFGHTKDSEASADDGKYLLLSLSCIIKGYGEWHEFQPPRGGEYPVFYMQSYE